MHTNIGLLMELRKPKKINEHPRNTWIKEHIAVSRFLPDGPQVIIKHILLTNGALGWEISFKLGVTQTFKEAWFKKAGVSSQPSKFLSWIYHGGETYKIVPYKKKEE